jgi:hypothetical protein
LLALRVADVLHGRADRCQLVLCLLPLPLLYELLHLLQFGLGGEGHLVATGDRRRSEQRGVQAVERIARASPIDERAKAAEAQQRRSDRPDHGDAEPVAWACPMALGEGCRRFRKRDDVRVRGAANLVAPAGEHRRDRIRGRHPGTRGERVEQPIAARDRFQTGFELRHSRDLPR